MPVISVITATYDRLGLLPRALDGLVAQEFGDFEVVVVNDAGPDPTPVLDRYRDRLDIRLITNPTNLGVGPSQNAGIAAARGEYVCICSDDDRYLPKHLSTLHAATAPGTIPYTDGNQVLEDERGVVIRRALLETRTIFSRAHLLVENYLPSLSMLIPRRAFDLVGGAFHPELDVLEDWDLWLRLSAEFEFVHHPIVTFEYHLRGGSHNLTTREKWRFDRCLREVYDRHPLPPGSGLEPLRRRMLEKSDERADRYNFDVSIVVAGGADRERLLAALREIVAAATGLTYEIVLIVPRTRSMEELAAQVTGDISFIFTEATGDLERIARRRAAGRTVHVIDRLDDLRLDELPAPERDPVSA